MGAYMPATSWHTCLPRRGNNFTKWNRAKWVPQRGTHMPEGHLGPAGAHKIPAANFGLLAINLGLNCDVASRTRAHAHTY